MIDTIVTTIIRAKVIYRRAGLFQLKLSAQILISYNPMIDVEIYMTDL